MKKILFVLILAAFSLTAKAQIFRNIYINQIYPLMGVSDSVIRITADTSLFNGNVKITGNLITTASGSTTLPGSAEIGGTLNVTDILTVSGPTSLNTAEISGTLTVTGKLSGGNILATDSLTAQGVSSLDTVTISGTMTATKSITMSGLTQRETDTVLSLYNKVVYYQLENALDVDSAAKCYVSDSAKNAAKIQGIDTTEIKTWIPESIDSAELVTNEWPIIHTDSIGTGDSLIINAARIWNINSGVDAASVYSTVISAASTIANSRNSVIMGGALCSISNTSLSGGIISATGGVIDSSLGCVIVGGWNNNIGSTGKFIVNTVILGGTALSADKDNTAYAQNLWAKDTIWSASGHIATVSYSDTLAYGDSLLIVDGYAISNAWISVDTLGDSVHLSTFNATSDGDINGMMTTFGMDAISIGSLVSDKICVIAWNGAVYIKNNRWAHQRISYEIKILM